MVLIMLEAAKQQESDSVNSNNSINSSNHDDEHQQRRQGQSASPISATAAVTSPANPTSSPVVVVGGSTTSTSYDLAQFEPVRILNNNSTHKSVSLLGHFGNLSRDKFAIIVLEKTAFTEAQLRNYSVVTKAAVTQTTSSESESENSSTTAEVVVAAERSVFSSKSHLRTEFINDIYGNFLCVTDPEVNRKLHVSGGVRLRMMR